MLSPVILSIPALVLPLVLSPPADCQFGRLGDAAADERAVATFEVRIQDYVELHRRLARAWPPAGFFANPEQDERAADMLREALRDARPQAAQAGFFTPDVADVLRFRIANALRRGDYDLAVMTWPPETDDDGGRWKPEVNQPVPWGVSARRWPSLAMLPPLPPEVAFRFIGRDLVLVDVPANLVVDVLELALPTALPGPAADRDMSPPGEEFEGCRPE